MHPLPRVPFCNLTIFLMLGLSFTNFFKKTQIICHITACYVLNLKDFWIRPCLQISNSCYFETFWGTIHTQCRQFFQIFDTPSLASTVFLVLSVGNFDQFLTTPRFPSADVVYGRSLGNDTSVFRAYLVIILKASLTSFCFLV